MVCTQSDGRVVGRKSDQRELYLIFEQNNANLLEINGASRRGQEASARKVGPLLSQDKVLNYMQIAGCVNGEQLSLSGANLSGLYRWRSLAKGNPHRRNP